MGGASPSLRYLCGGGSALTRIAEAAAERHTGALVLLHPLVPHGFRPCDEGWRARTTAPPNAAGHDDVL